MPTVLHVTEGATIVAMEAKARAGVKEAVEERTLQNVCLIDDCGCEATRRGLCNKHYQQYRGERMKQPERDRLAFDAKQIKAGRLLHDRQGQRGVKNPFVD